jgi:hypothetical protein
MKQIIRGIVLLCVCAGSAAAQTQFTYQGRIDVNGSPATGLYDLRFRLYDAATGGSPVGGLLCADNVAVAGGAFSVALDFGAQFNGAARYLEIEARADTGLTCANAAGFVAVGPRQAVTAAPMAAFAANAAALNGQAASFYTNAANLASGTIPDGRLAVNVVRTNAAQTFTAAQTFFNPANTFTGSGAGLTSLNATSIASGTLADARLSSNVALLNAAQTFTAAQTFSSASNSFTGSGAGLTALNAGNIASGTLADARLSSNIPRLNAAANFTSTGSFAGALGVGTSSPTSLLELRAADPQLRVRNVNDTGGGVVLNTFGSLQLGLFNPSGADWGVVPAGGYRAVLALDNQGRVGSVTNTSAGPAYRNFLDDGSGNASFVGTGTFGGRVTATEASATSGTIQGTHTGTFTNQYGMFGLASTTGASSAVGVRGEARGNSGSGLYGVATTTSGQAYGVVGLGSSTNTLSAGVYGESAAANGVYGYSSSGRALYGRSDTNYGVYAQTTSGGVALYGVRTANNNRGWFGGAGEGGWAESATGTGFVAKSTSGAYALYAERNPGGTPANVNRGWFGGSGEGAWAESDQGNGLVALSRGLNAAAVYCRNDAGGRALFADGVAAVRALEILGGADLAEPFEVEGEPVPGMVVCIHPDRPGRLRVSGGAYDTTVAGIISGANGLSPGMVMRDQGGTHTDGRHAVAMTGRVWCWADATGAEIRPGDRLTTADTPGHAMRVTDEARAPGAVIGKAMTPLPAGERGLVLVLVNLQ